MIWRGLRLGLLFYALHAASALLLHGTSLLDWLPDDLVGMVAMVAFLFALPGWLGGAFGLEGLSTSGAVVALTARGWTVAALAWVIPWLGLGLLAASALARRETPPPPP